MAGPLHAVVPSHDVSQVSPATKYTLVTSRALPSIDCSKTLKSVLLPPTALRRWNATIHNFRKQINLASAIGMIGAVVPIVPAPIGAWCACLGVALQSIGLMSAFSSLRFDVVAILLGSFEFWDFSMTNLLCSIAVLLCYGDWRGAGCPTNALGVQVILLIDAFYRPLNLAIAGSVAAAAMYLSLLILLSLGLVDQQRDFRVASSRSHHLTVVDIATNASATMVFLLLRNVYRKRVALRQHGADSSRVSCIMYRCCVQFRELAATHHSPSTAVPSVAVRVFESVDRPQALSHGSPAPLFTQLVCVEQHLTFHVHETVWPWLSRCWPRHARVGLRISVQCLGALGLIATVGSFSMSSYRTHLAIAALVVTGVYTVLVLSLLHRRVMHQLRHSFDYLFVSAQLTIAHICVCDMISWDLRSLSILSLWLWLHVVISVDALLPPMRRALGISRVHLACILIAAATLGGVFCVELIAFDPPCYRNRPYISVRLHDRRIELRVTPLLFGRVFSLSWWIARLLWRIQDRRDDELIMLQGKVEFEDLLLQARKQANHKRHGATAAAGSSSR
ncbi:hypothetical protein PINS_up004801 [Pythium insidiosum]|nr:hypothetical protein PINS_up004801 [Pythium insidiosum]